MHPVRSTFDGADHDSLDEELLDKRIDDQKGQARHNNYRIANRLAQTLGPYRCLHIRRHGRGVSVNDKDVTKHNLQRVQGLVLQVQECIEVLVPLPYCIEKRENRYNCPTQGEYKGEEEADIRASVYLSGLIQFIRDILLQECTGNDDIPYGYRIGEDDGEPGIIDTELAYHQVKRNDSTGEEHCEEDELGYKLPSIELFPGERIGDQHGEHYTDNRSGNHIVEAVHVSGSDLLVGKDGLVTYQVEVYRKEPNFACHHRLGFTQ